MENKQDRIKLSGFNNLTKVLSFNLYDFLIAVDDKRKQEYIDFIDEKYNAQKIEDISRKICEIIDAEILNVSKQDYDPVGASTMVLMSDVQGGGWKQEKGTAQVSCHPDKSHITAHTYPDASDPNGICSFRVDIDIATCGEIIPLKAINLLFESFECDVVFIDYVVRGFTRTEDGKKIYCDHYFNSIQDFIKPEILKQYEYRQDLNMAHENIWQTKLMINSSLSAENYVMEPEDVNSAGIDKKMQQLSQEMREVFHLS